MSEAVRPPSTLTGAAPVHKAGVAQIFEATVPTSRGQLQRQLLLNSCCRNGCGCCWLGRIFTGGCLCSRGRLRDNFRLGLSTGLDDCWELGSSWIRCASWSWFGSRRWHDCDGHRWLCRGRRRCSKKCVGASSWHWLGALLRMTGNFCWRRRVCGWLLVRCPGNRLLVRGTTVRPSRCGSICLLLLLLLWLLWLLRGSLLLQSAPRLLHCLLQHNLDSVGML
jgi:hypothetical protein